MGNQSAIRGICDPQYLRGAGQAVRRHRRRRWQAGHEVSRRVRCLRIAIVWTQRTRERTLELGARTASSVLQRNGCRHGLRRRFANQTPGEEINRVNDRIYREILESKEMRTEEKENQQVHPDDVPVGLDENVLDSLALFEGG